MLTIKATPHSSSSSSADDVHADQWKILIYDAECRDIISPLMNISALHQKGVTLYLMVLSPIPFTLSLNPS